MVEVQTIFSQINIYVIFLRDESIALLLQFQQKNKRLHKIPYSRLFTCLEKEIYTNAPKYSRFISAMFSILISFGQTASHSP